jgi:predicted dehydrogenase
MKNLSRRSFIRNSTLVAASVALSARSWSQVPGANDAIRVATVGFNGRGGNHLDELSKTKGVRYTALCDADQKVLDHGIARLKKEGCDVEGFTDIRKLLESKNLDLITIATPNHWHALGSIWAIQAGKDVYVEKPVSHNVWEGRQIVKTARQHGRIVQTGTQSRSNTGMRQAIAWLHEGNLGKIIRARGLCYKRRASIGKTTGPQPIPESVDYDLWCGPAPKDPLRRARLHYDWHWVWPTGNGDLGNQGIHQMDIARWALGVNDLSPRVFSVGGRLGYDDDGTTPNTLIVFHDYKPAPLIFEVRGLPSKEGSSKMDDYRGAGIGVVVDCENGSLVIPSYSSAAAFDKDGKEIKKFSGGASHFANFLKAVQSRKSEDLNADILEGHISSALCHTGNISYRLGKAQSPEEIRAAVRGNKDMAEAIGRMEEHLGVNTVDLHKTPATLGAILQMDPKAERFTDNAKANELLTREYRRPFVVPEKV